MPIDINRVQYARPFISYADPLTSITNHVISTSHRDLYLHKQETMSLYFTRQ